MSEPTNPYTAPLNPYAVPTAVEEDSFHCVYFGGTATRDDLRMALLDAPRQSGLSRLKGPTTLFGISAAILFLTFRFTERGEPVPSIVWLVLGFMALPTWLHIARILTPGRRKMVERIDRMAPKQTPTWGWLDQEYVVLRDQKSVLKARWSFFAPPMIFPEHLMLPLNSDANHRVVLPWRYFTASDDVNSVIEFLTKQQKVVNKQQHPKPETLVELTNQCDGYVHSDIEEAKQWTNDRWPFESSEDGQFDCEIDTSAVMTTRWFALYSAIAIGFVIAWYFLPIWVAMVAWLIYEYSFFGNWNFISERLFSSLLMLVPAGLTLIFFGYFILKSVLISRKMQKQPMAIRLRTTGAHLTHDTFQSWFRWELIKEVIVKDDKAGWMIEETGDEIAFPKICFGDEQTFAKFKDVLNNYGPQPS